jgi:hypothetical protein
MTPPPPASPPGPSSPGPGFRFRGGRGNTVLGNFSDTGFEFENEEELTAMGNTSQQRPGKKGKRIGKKRL